MDRSRWIALCWGLVAGLLGTARTDAAPTGWMGDGLVQPGHKLDRVFGGSRLIVVAEAGQRMLVLDASLAVLADKTLDSTIGTLAHDGQSMYLAFAGTREVQRYNPNGGKANRWSWPGQAVGIDDMDAAGGLVLMLDSASSRLHWAESAGGRPVLSFPAASESVSQISLDGGLLWQYDGGLAATDPGTGEVLMRVELSTTCPRLAGMAVAAGELYLACASGRIDHVDLLTGKPLGHADLGMPIEQLAVSKRGAEQVFGDGFENPPVLLVSPVDGGFTNQVNVDLMGTVDGTVTTLTINAQSVDITGGVFSFPVMLSEGPNPFDFDATRANGPNFQFQAIVNLDTQAPAPLDTDLLDSTLPAAGQSTQTGFAGSVEPGASVQITNTRTAEMITVSADVAGAFVQAIGAAERDDLSFVVMDAAGNASTAVIARVPGTNAAPVLDPIGTQAVSLGQTLGFTVSATDLDGDPLSMMAFPLPANASFDGNTGEFSFRPVTGQEGDIDVQFTVSDGVQSDLEQVTITVTGAGMGGVTSLTGVVIDTNDFVATGTMTPVVGAIVSILNSGVSEVTGADGSFSLSGIPHGIQIFDIDATGVVAPDGSDYAGFREELPIIADVDNSIDRPFFLPRIDMASLQTVDPDNTTTIINAALGVRIVIPPHTAKSPDGSDYAGEMSISLVPDAVAPAALPPDLGFGLLITIQPVGVYFIEPVEIFFPNSEGLPNGTRVDIWSLDPATGQFAVVGTGEAQGAEIRTISGGVNSADWHGRLRRGTTGTEGEDKENCDYCKKLKELTGSETAVGSGSLRIEHDLVDYQSLGRSRGMTLVYNSALADPRPVITSIASLDQAPPDQLAVRVRSGGLLGAREIVYDTTSRDTGDRVSIAGQFDASTLPTGIYDYSMEIESRFPLSRVTSRQEGKVTINNLSDSPVGSGWSLAGVDRLIEQPDGIVLLVQGDGSSRQYRPLFNGTGQFLGTESLNTGPAPKKPVIADFDGNGAPDFAIANGFFSGVIPSDNHIGVYLNDGNGEFTFSRFDIDLIPQSMGVGDFNGDADLDLIVPGLDRLYLYVGNGDGTFQTPGVHFMTMDSQVNGADSVAVGDFDGDTNPDIAFPNTRVDGSSITVLFGPDGTGNFIARLDLFSGNDPDAVVAAHLNNDTDLDLAVANRGGGSASVFLGDGTQTLGTGVPMEYPADTSPDEITAGDVNDDGFSDLILATTNNRSISILINNQDGTFAAPLFGGTGGVASDVAVGNFDGDPNLDIAVSNSSNNNISILRGSGFGGFPVSRDYNVGDVPEFVNAADFDGDGIDDVIVVNDFNDTVSILPGLGRGDLRATQRIPEADSHQANDGIVVDDFNGDRVDDVAVAKRFRLELYFGDGQDLRAATEFVVNQLRDKLQKADLDQDGDMDLIMVNTNGSDQFLLTALNDGVGDFSNQVQTPVNRNPVDMAMADFNRDGLPDAAVVHQDPGSATRQVSVFIGQGDGSFVLSPGSSMDLPNSPEEVAAADITGDGFPDAVTYDFQERLLVFPGDGAGGLGAGVETLIGTTANSFELGDIDGNGTVDVVVANGNVSNFVSIGFGNNSGQFINLTDVEVCPVVNFNNSTSPDDLLLRDLDGDDDLDLALICRTLDTVRTALNDGNGNFTPSKMFQGVQTTNIEAGDFNRDGTPDLVSSIDNGLALLPAVPDRSMLVGYRSPNGDFSTLVKNGDDSFTRSLTDGSVIQYDTAGRQTSITDRNGNAVQFAYDGMGRLMTVTDPAGLTTTLTYVGDRLSTLTDPASRTTSLFHDGNGNLTRILDPDGAERLFDYDIRHRLTRQTSPRGFQIRYDYNFAGMNWRVIRPDGSVRIVRPASLAIMPNPASGIGTDAVPAPSVLTADLEATARDGRGGVTRFGINRFESGSRVTDPLNRTTSVTRNGENRVIRLDRPGGSIDLFSYDRRGNLTTATVGMGSPDERSARFNVESQFNQPEEIIDPLGHSIAIEYDANGNPTRMVDQLGFETEYTWTAQGLVMTEMPPHDPMEMNAPETLYTYDANGNIETLTNGLGEVTRFTRDAAGNILTVTRAFGTPQAVTRSFTYDAANRTLTRTDETSITTQWRYDEAGNLDEMELATGEIVSYGYDALDRLVSSTSTVTGTTGFELDLNGNLVRMTGVTGTTTYAYDAADQRIRSIDALGNEQVLGRDMDGAVTSIRNGNGRDILITRDALGRVTGVTDPLMGEVQFAYDARDQVTSITDPNGDTLTYVYDDRLQLTQVVTPDDSLLFGYDARGNRVAAMDNDTELSFAYDALNRLTQAVTEPAGLQPNVTLDYGYDNLDNRTSIVDSVAGTTALGYDDRGRLNQVTTPALDVIGLDYDPAGRPLLIDYSNGVDVNFVYDPQGRLTQVNHDLMGGGIFAQFDYGYDSRGRINAIIDGAGSQNYSYDANGRLNSAAGVAAESYAYDGEGNRTASHLSTSYSYDDANRLTADDQFTYAYDANGRLIQRTRISDGMFETFDYDFLGQLIQHTAADGTVSTYAYDALGRRVEKNVDGQITRYVYDGHAIRSIFDGTDTLIAQFDHGQDIDQPLAMRTGGASYFYHMDHRGSVAALTDAVGMVVNDYRYDAFGNRLSANETLLNPYTFAAREWDAETGLIYLRARYYAPDQGRFITPDPLGLGGQNSNLYEYVRSNPLNRLDPLGLQDVDVNYGKMARDVGLLIGGSLPGPLGSGIGILGTGVGVAEDTDGPGSKLATVGIGAVGLANPAAGFIVGGWKMTIDNVGTLYDIENQINNLKAQAKARKIIAARQRADLRERFRLLNEYREKCEQQKKRKAYLERRRNRKVDKVIDRILEKGRRRDLSDLADILNPPERKPEPPPPPADEPSDVDSVIDDLQPIIVLA